MEAQRPRKKQQEFLETQQKREMLLDGGEDRWKALYQMPVREVPFLQNE